MGKREIARYESSILKRFILQTYKNTQQILDPSKLKEFADENFKFDENDGKFSKPVENTMGTGKKMLVMSNFPFSQSVFKTFILQTRKPRASLGKG